MKLSPEQIQELYAFTKKHFVEHYDLQTELVDHLANGIETQWANNPEITFKTALNNEYKKFGVFGFEDVIKDKRKALNKKYLKIIKQYYLEYFKLPKIMITLSLITTFYFILMYIPNEKKMIFSISLFAVSLFLLAYRGILLFIKRKRKIKKKEKIWMLEDIILTQGGIGMAFLFFPFHIFNFLTSFEIIKESFQINSDFIQILLISFIILYLIFFYVMIIVIPPKAKKFLKETYPEYKFAS